MAEAEPGLDVIARIRRVRDDAERRSCATAVRGRSARSPAHIKYSDDAAHGLAPWLPAWSAVVADEAAEGNRHGPVTKQPRRVELAGS